jgi:3-oxoacyl-[acyl-carrier-protein] synthase II
VNRGSAQSSITGVGLITPLGQKSQDTFSALLAGRFISDHTHVPGFAGSTRCVDLAIAAGAEALAAARWGAEHRASPETGLFIGASKGTIETWMQPANLSLPLWGLAQIDTEFARRLNFGAGPRMTLSSACSSGLHALARAAMAIEFCEITRALVIATEASVHRLFISSFERLGVLPPKGYGCRPFDEQRRGFVMSEGAAAVCLERRAAGENGGLARIDAWAIGADATHLTAGDPQALSLRRLLQRVGAQHCDLVHAHATGTLVNDPAELAAICAVAGGAKAHIYSHKGALGHSLGAAGLTSVVINCLCHGRGIVPGNVQTRAPLPMEGIRFSAEPVNRAVRRSIALAAGFGGPLAAVALSSD